MSATGPERGRTGHRPASLTTQVAAAPGLDDHPGRRAEFAEELVDALLAVGRQDPAAALARADQVGLATLGESWGGAETMSRPGLLWTLHLVRTWCYFQGEAAARFIGQGRHAAPVAAAIAGLPEGVGAQELAGAADQMLLGAYSGELGGAAERASAVLELAVQGMRELGEAPAQVRRTRLLAERLAHTGRAWRRTGLS